MRNTSVILNPTDKREVKASLKSRLRTYKLEIKAAAANVKLASKTLDTLQKQAEQTKAQLEAL